MLTAVWFDAIESLKCEGMSDLLIELEQDGREFLESDENSQPPRQICFHHLPSD